MRFFVFASLCYSILTKSKDLLFLWYERIRVCVDQFILTDFIQTDTGLSNYCNEATKQNMPKREHSTTTSSTDSRSESSLSTLNQDDKGHDDTVTIKRLKLENKELLEKLKEFNNLKKELNSTKEQLNTTMEQLKNREEWLRCILDKI